jgi:hypothetical protein
VEKFKGMLSQENKEKVDQIIKMKKINEEALTAPDAFSSSDFRHFLFYKIIAQSPSSN